MNAEVAVCYWTGFYCDGIIHTKYWRLLLRPQGYFRLKMGEGPTGLCEIASVASYPVKTSPNKPVPLVGCESLRGDGAWILNKWDGYCRQSATVHLVRLPVEVPLRAVSKLQSVCLPKPPHNSLRSAPSPRQ